MNSQATAVENNLANAPEEVRERLTAHYKALNRFRKSQHQVDLWHRELEDAAKEVQFTQSAYAEVLGRWNLETNTLRPTERMELDL